MNSACAEVKQTCGRHEESDDRQPICRRIFQEAAEEDIAVMTKAYERSQQDLQEEIGEEGDDKTKGGGGGAKMRRAPWLRSMAEIHG